MGLTYCPDCSATISDAAPACPHCGRPFAPDPLQQLAAASYPQSHPRQRVQVIEQTAKRWKSHLFFSKLLGVCGLLALLAIFALHIRDVQAAPPSAPPDWTPQMRAVILCAAIAIVIALAWNSWARFMAWWHHG